jgi:hypothetical protein
MIPIDPFTKLEKLSKKLDKLKEPVYINGRKKRITKETQLAIEKTKPTTINYTLNYSQKTNQKGNIKNVNDRFTILGR